MTMAPYDSPEGGGLAQFDRADEFGEPATAPGISARLEPVRDGEVAGGRLNATNSSNERRGSWAQFEKVFDPPLDLSEKQGLGVWVRGDGKGEVLNFQMESPDHPDPSWENQEYIDWRDRHALWGGLPLGKRGPLLRSRGSPWTSKSEAPYHFLY